MFIEQPPWFFRALYPQAIFRMDPNERAVYLTFDDGPIPEVTPWVLELLEKHNIKATFFMVGDNIKKHPDEYRIGGRTRSPHRQPHFQPHPWIRILQPRLSGKCPKSR